MLTLPTVRPDVVSRRGYCFQMKRSVSDHGKARSNRVATAAGEPEYDMEGRSAVKEPELIGRRLTEKG
jgi:hypothetical protein